MKAPEWYRGAGARPAPPGVTVGLPPPQGAQSAAGGPSLQRSGAGPLPGLPVAAPPAALIQQQVSQPPPPDAPPALAQLPPPPSPGQQVLALLPAAPPASPQGAGRGGVGGSLALAVAGHSGSAPSASPVQAGLGGTAASAEVVATVGPAPALGGQQAFTIPGLQPRPFTENELATAWEMMDLDGHGALEIHDLRRTLELCGEPQATNAELQEMIRMLGKRSRDGTWKVRYPDFWRAFTNPPQVFRNWDLHRRDIHTPPMSPAAPCAFSSDDDDENEGSDFGPSGGG